MIWFGIFGGIALLGLFVLVSYAVWLWHKASDLFFELERIGAQLGELGELLSSLETHKFEKSSSL